MAEVDWADFTNSLAAGVIRRGVTMAPALLPPEGYFLFGFHSLLATAGAVAMHPVQANFSPTLANKGGIIEAILKRYSSGSGYAPMIFFANAANLNTAIGYILGLSDEAAYKIVLKKGTIKENLLSTDSGKLRVSDQAFSTAQYHHLKFELILNPQGDVVLNVYANDLTAHLPSAPTWVAISGMSMYVDDSLGILSGTVPTTGGYYFGIGVYSEVAARASLFDYVRIARQLNP